ncbi:hypothetical protein SDC9_98197 [bioreactor metagenome]|uniref:Uncharacterized protein n=1 Tax=bioreactor metagenome TaxID=1076179 RepID=A0A645AFF8_9ZZZZ|nr:hypothetical protein [Petrimonas sp.]
MQLHLSKPKNITFFIALILAVLALLMVVIPFTLLFGPIWWALIAFAILALGNLLKGM